VLANYDTTKRDDPSHQNEIVDILYDVFTCLFAIEAIMKIIAQGLYEHRRSFLRKWWNIIDSITIILGYIKFHLTLL